MKNLLSCLKTLLAASPLKCELESDFQMVPGGCGGGRGIKYQNQPDA